MSFQPFSRLCVQRLTQLLELDCLEGFQDLEDCPYVAQNIQIEDRLPYNNIELKNSASNTAIKKSPKSQIKRIFKDISKKGIYREMQNKTYMFENTSHINIVLKCDWLNVYLVDIVYTCII